MTYKSKVERNRKDRERYHANPEPAKEKARKQYHVNPGKQQQYYQEHIEEAAIRNHEQYAKNPAYFNDRSTQRRQELREFLQQQKMGRSCMRCGNSDSRVLDFHHLERTGKEGRLSQAVAKNWSKERIVREIAKCETLCANCHRILHWEERGGGMP